MSNITYRVTSLAPQVEGHEARTDLMGCAYFVQTYERKDAALAAFNAAPGKAEVWAYTPGLNYGGEIVRSRAT